MAENARDFKGVWIPRAVWLDNRLNALEKIILTEIDSLDMGEDGCWASNKYIADFCQCSETKVSTAISKLIVYGYLSVKSFDGRQRILKSRLSNFERQTFKNEKAGYQNLKESNTYNNSNNNTSKKDIGEKRTRFIPPTLEDVQAYCEERQNGVDAEKFIDYYTSNGWQVGKNKMRDWKAAVRTWEKNGFDKQSSAGQKKPFKPTLGHSFDANEFFEAAVAKTWKDKEQPKTAAEDEEVREKAEALKSMLGQA